MPTCDCCNNDFAGEPGRTTCGRCEDFNARLEDERQAEEMCERRRRELSPEYARRQFLYEEGIAVYQVGNLFDTDAEGKPIPESDRDKWFVSAPTNSPYVPLVTAIPLAATEEEAWELADKHLPREAITAVTAQS